METVELKATSRAKGSKGAARRLRSSGRVPAVCYGNGIDVMEIAFESANLYRIIEGPLGRNTILDLNIDDGAKHCAAMIKSVQKDPVSRRLVHVDFFAVREDREVVVSVPIRLVGQSIGVKRGGKMRQIARTVMLKCLPGNIPAEVTFDVSEMQLKERAQISQVVAPEGTQLLFDHDFAIAQVNAPRADNLVDAEEEGEEQEAAEEEAEA